MAPAHSPTIRARRLGRYLRDLRDSHRLSISDVAARVDVNHMTIRRVEHGLHKTDRAVIEELLDIYEVGHTKRRELLALADEAFRRGWWLEYGDVLDEMFAVLEDEADRILSFQAHVVPGLLQTDAYARALFTCWPAPNATGADDAVKKRLAEEIERRVRARRSRRDILDRADGPHLHALLSESALRQQVGGPDVMREQLRYLISAARTENVTVQVVPFAAGAYAGLSGSFTLWEFEHADDPAVAYTENLSGSAYSESVEALDRFTLAWGSVVDAALSPDQSVSMIDALITEG